MNMDAPSFAQSLEREAETLRVRSGFLPRKAGKLYVERPKGSMVLFMAFLQ